MYLSGIVLHEMGHWAVAKLLGCEPVWGVNSLVQIYDRTPTHPENWLSFSGGWFRMKSFPNNTVELFFFHTAGVINNLLCVIIGLLFTQFSKHTLFIRLGLLVALINSFFVLLSQILSSLGNRGDEYNTANLLGISVYAVTTTLGVFSLIGLIVGTSKIREWKERLKLLFIILLGGIIGASVTPILNHFVRDQLDMENPLFQPVFGVSFPVLIINIILFFLFIYLFVKWMKPKTDENNLAI